MWFVLHTCCITCLLCVACTYEYVCSVMWNMYICIYVFYTMCDLYAYMRYMCMFCVLRTYVLYYVICIGRAQFVCMCGLHMSSMGLYIPS